MKEALFASVVFSLVYGLIVVLQQNFIRTAISPLHLNFLTYSTAALIFSLCLLLFKRSAFRITSRRGAVLAILTGIISGLICDLPVFIGLQYSSSISWAVLSRLIIFSTAFFSFFLLKERFSPKQILSLFLSFGGAVLVVASSSSVFQLGLGDGLFLLAIVGFGLLNITTQIALKYITILQQTFLRLVFASLAAVLPLYFSPLKEISAAPFVVINGLSFIFGVVVAGIIIKKAGASFFAVASNMIPIFVALFAILLLREWPTVNQIFGGTLIIFSIFLFSQTKPRSEENSAR